MLIGFESWEEKTLNGKDIYDHSSERNKNLVSKDSALVHAVFIHTPTRKQSHSTVCDLFYCASLCGQAYA